MEVNRAKRLVAAASARAGSGRPGGRAADSGEGHRETKLRSTPDDALHGDLASVHLDDLPGDREAEPGPDDLAGMFVLVSLVAPEQPADEFRRGALAVGRDAYSDRAAGQPAAHADLAPERRGLDR